MAMQDWDCVGYSEIDKYALAVYRYHFPNHKNYGDATRISTNELPDFDLLTAGFPCQAFSVAGKQGGFEDHRGTLFFEIARVLTDKRPRYILLENVKGLLSVESGKVFQRILGILAQIGYELQWDVVNSKSFVPQNRERIFIVGHLRGTSRPKVFPLGEGNQASDAEESAVSYCIDANYAKGAARASRTMIAQRPHGHCDGSVSDMAPALRASIQSNAAVISINYSNHQQDRVYDPTGIMCQLSAGTHGNAGHLLKIFGPTGINRPSRGPEARNDGLACTVKSVQNQITDGINIRRLTPIECERLQGFFDNYTKYGINENNEKVEISDTQRYRLLGNAVTVPVAADIVRRFA